MSFGLGIIASSQYIVTTPGTTYATFDASLISANLTRDNSLQVTNNGGGNGTAIATIGGSTTGKSTGKWYWEFKYTTKTNQGGQIGRAHV